MMATDASSPHIVLTGHCRRVKSIAAIGADCLASGSEDGSVRVWCRSNPASIVSAWECVAELEGHSSSVDALALLPDGCLVSGSGDMRVRVWRRVEPGSMLSPWECEVVLNGHMGWIKAIAVLPDGCPASGGYDNTVRVWCRLRAASSTSVWECAAVLKGHTGAVMSLAALPDGLLVSGGDDYDVRVWRRSDAGSISSQWECVETLAYHTHSVTALTVLSDGSFASGSIDKIVRVWRRSAHASMSQMSSRWVCTECWEATSHCFDTLTMLPDGSLMSCHCGGVIRLWRRSGSARTLRSSPRWECVSVLKGHSSRVWALAVLPDGCLVTGGQDRTLRAWLRTASLEWASRRAVIEALLLISRRGWGSAAYVSTKEGGRPRVVRRLLATRNA